MTRGHKPKTKTQAPVKPPKSGTGVTRASKKSSPSKAIDKLTAEIMKESPIPNSLRKRETARQLAQQILIRNLWTELELQGELPNEKSRQLARMTSEARKMWDELGIEQAKAEEPEEDFGG